MADLDVVTQTLLDEVAVNGTEEVAGCRTGAKQFQVKFADGSADDCTVDFYGSVNGGLDYDDDPFHTVTITAENAAITSFASDDRYSYVKAAVSVLTGGAVSVWMSQ